MDTDSPDLIELYHGSAAEFDRVLAGTTADQYAGPTPCEEWDVRHLVDHVVGGNLMFAAWGSGGPEPDRSADFLGDDPLAAYRGSIERLDAVFASDDFLARDVRTPFGPGTGSTLVGMRFNELLVHTWDLAKGTGQLRDLDPRLCEVSLRFFEQTEIPRTAGGMFGEIKPVPDGAPIADRLAAYVGRDVTA